MENIGHQPNSFWVIGGGRFGNLALERIMKNNPQNIVTIVDINPMEITSHDVKVVCEDGIHWLYKQINQQRRADVIVPALPLHMVVNWLRIELLPEYSLRNVKIRDKWIQGFPNVIKNGEGQIFMSFADFLCPDSCNEPEKICSYTGLARKENLFSTLRNAFREDLVSLAVRSYQLFPGVGGVLIDDLLNVRDKVIKEIGKNIMISTCCRCHGVADFVVCEGQNGK
ncbi:MAG: hypothetical protein GY705_30185 [Bacteroidetes bacterium]|nr:hypothetical protein [Bacteroidota bacterium]